MTEYYQNIIGMAKGLRDKVSVQEVEHDESQVFWSGMNFWLNLIAPLVGATLSGVGTIIAAQSNNYSLSILFGIITTILSGISIVISTLRDTYDPQKRSMKHAKAGRKYFLLGDQIERFYKLRNPDKLSAENLLLDDQVLLSEYNDLVQQFDTLRAEDESNDILPASRVRRIGFFSWLRPRHIVDTKSLAASETFISDSATSRPLFDSNTPKPR